MIFAIDRVAERSTSSRRTTVNSSTAVGIDGKGGLKAAKVEKAKEGAVGGKLKLARLRQALLSSFAGLNYSQLHDLITSSQIPHFLLIEHIQWPIVEISDEVWHTRSCIADLSISTLKARQ
jgi:hypothetical protein